MSRKHAGAGGALRLVSPFGPTPTSQPALAGGCNAIAGFRAALPDIADGRRAGVALQAAGELAVEFGEKRDAVRQTQVGTGEASAATIADRVGRTSSAIAIGAHEQILA